MIFCQALPCPHSFWAKRSTTKLWFQPHIRLTFFQDSSMLKHKQYFRFSCLILFCCMCLQHTGFLSLYASSDRQLDTFISSAVVNRADPGSLSAVLCGTPKSGNAKSYGNSLLLRSCPTGKTTAVVLSAAVLWGLLQATSSVAAWFYALTSTVQGVPFQHSLARIYFLFFNFIF